MLSLGVLGHSFYSLCEGDGGGGFPIKGSPIGEGGENNLEKLLKNASEGNFNELGKTVYYTIDSGAPGKIGYGFLMGYSSGFCLKKVSKIIAFSVGGVFILAQVLSSQGYLTINHERIGNELEVTCNFKLILLCLFDYFVESFGC